MNELREYLESIGFKFSINNLRDEGNQCDWYAYRRSKLKARRCECNDKEFMQIVIKPYLYIFNEIQKSEGVEIELSGEANGEWWEIKAYGIAPEAVKDKLDKIERSLISAWNAI
jgi:hypothetical protein